MNAPIPPPPKKLDDDQHLDVPYVAPATPAAPVTGAPPTISTLPPIAMARPVGENCENNANGGNIPVVNGVRQVPTGSYGGNNPQYPPTIVNLSAAPSAAGPHMIATMEVPPLTAPFFEFMDRCRFAAGLMLCYYMCTFFFLQPFFLGIMGVLTGFLGYYGSRPPIFAAHLRWIRGYIWMNYAMMGMNLWYLAITVFFVTTYSSNKAYDTTSYRFNEQHLGLFIGIVVTLNMLLHFRGVRTAKKFHAEMLRASPLPGERTVIVLGDPA